MTCREKLAVDHPKLVDETWIGGCSGCPYMYGYLDKPEWCGTSIYISEPCTRCWDREIPENSPSSQAVSQGKKDDNETKNLTLTVTYNNGTREKFFEVSGFDFSPQNGLFKIKYISPNKHTYISVNQITKIDTKIKELI